VVRKFAALILPTLHCGDRQVLRHTFATQNLQDHVCDIRTLQQWQGHNDLASTMVYLKAVRSKDVVERLTRAN